MARWDSTRTHEDLEAKRLARERQENDARAIRLERRIFDETTRDLPAPADDTGQQQAARIVEVPRILFTDEELEHF